MFTTNDNKLEFRNLEEQVQKNKEDIANHYAIDRSLANFGIKIVGTVSSVEQLPDPLTFNGEYGDGYAVGQPGSYEYYIYTRPNLNAGQTNNYWLNAGSISIRGPQGPKGDKGDKGESGESNRWYTGSYPANPNVGDMFLSNSGQVFQNVGGSAWTPVTTIKGPQGIQGIQGPRGEKGEQGVQGPKGDTGDVGGFINIYGTLQNTNQLPTPQSLKNLTIAYLIEHAGGDDQANDHYDLYIQVGETSETALWINAGPFNAATLVTVNGLGQNVWDADVKADKADLDDYIRKTDAALESQKINLKNGQGVGSLEQILPEGTSNNPQANGSYSVALNKGKAVGIGSFASGSTGTNGGAFGEWSFIAGGTNAKVQGRCAITLAGDQNKADGRYDIVGGYNNLATENTSNVVVFGQGNIIDGDNINNCYADFVNGELNTITDGYGSYLGGIGNTLKGRGMFVTGAGIVATGVNEQDKEHSYFSVVAGSQLFLKASGYGITLLGQKNGAVHVKSQTDLDELAQQTGGDTLSYNNDNSKYNFDTSVYGAFVTGDGNYAFHRGVAMFGNNHKGSSRAYQFIAGTMAAPDKDAIMLIGNGSGLLRKNALVVKSDGRVVGGRSTISSDSPWTLTTKDYTDNLISELRTEIAELKARIQTLENN